MLTLVARGHVAERRRDRRAFHGAAAGGSAGSADASSPATSVAAEIIMAALASNAARARLDAEHIVRHAPAADGQSDRAQSRYDEEG
jgi:hypothetical protein